MAFMRPPVRFRLAPPKRLDDEQMMKKISGGTLRIVFSFVLFGLFLFYLVSYHGLLIGTHLTLLIWSLYILTIPGGHGQYLIGLPVYSLTEKTIYSEPFLWCMAVVLNIFTFSLNPQIYNKTLFTYFFYQILATPNPHWIILLISALGTCYNTIFKLSYFGNKPIIHRISRSILILAGIVSFFYFSYPDLVICLNIFIQ